MASGTKSVAFDLNPETIKFERALDEELSQLWWTPEERRIFQAESRAEQDPLFAEALKNYQKSIYRKSMTELRIDMSNYIHMSEEEKERIRNAFIRNIQRIAYDETDINNFYNSEFYADYKKKLQKKKGGKKSRTTRRKKRTKRRRQKRTKRRK
jgi:hypothetical protein